MTEEDRREGGRKKEQQEEYRSIQWSMFPYIGWYAEPLSIGQSEHLVVIKHTVQVLHPLWINITIKDDPLPFVDLTTDIVNDSSSTDIQRKMLITVYTKKVHTGSNFCIKYVPHKIWSYKYQKPTANVCR